MYRRAGRKVLQKFLAKNVKQLVPSQPHHPQSGPLKQVRAQGYGGAGGTRSCRDCSTVCGGFVPKMGHSCVEYLIAQGKDLLKSEHTKNKFRAGRHSSMTQEAAREFLAKKFVAAEKDKKRKR